MNIDGIWALIMVCKTNCENYKPPAPEHQVTLLYTKKAECLEAAKTMEYTYSISPKISFGMEGICIRAYMDEKQLNRLWPVWPNPDVKGQVPRD